MNEDYKQQLGWTAAWLEAKWGVTPAAVGSTFEWGINGAAVAWAIFNENRFKQVDRCMIVATPLLWSENEKPTEGAKIELSPRQRAGLADLLERAVSGPGERMRGEAETLLRHERAVKGAMDWVSRAGGGTLVGVIDVFDGDAIWLWAVNGDGTEELASHVHMLLLGSNKAGKDTDYALDFQAEEAGPFIRALRRTT